MAVAAGVSKSQIQSVNSVLQSIKGFRGTPGCSASGQLLVASPTPSLERLSLYPCSGVWNCACVCLWRCSCHCSLSFQVLAIGPVLRSSATPLLRVPRARLPNEDHAAHTSPLECAGGTGPPPCGPDAEPDELPPAGVPRGGDAAERNAGRTTSVPQSYT